MRMIYTAVLAGALLAPFALAQKIELKLDNFKAKAKESNEVDLDGPALNFASKFVGDKEAKKGEEDKVKQTLLGVKGVYVRNYEFDQPGQYTEADVEGVLKQVRSNPAWSRLVSVREKEERVEVHIMSQGDVVQGLLVVAAEPKEFTVVNIVGPIPIDLARGLAQSNVHYDLGALMQSARK